MSELLAAIDVGSNAVRLLVANASEEEGSIRISKHNLFRIPLRLGKDVYKNGRIGPEREAMFLDTMMAFRHLLNIYKPVELRACATAAMREASNGLAILETIRKKTGIDIHLIDGLEEARLIRNTGAVKAHQDFQLTMFMDVGGGSTEISVLSENGLLSQRSFSIGALRLLESGVDQKEWSALEQYLEEYRELYGKINILGSGGNINKLVKLFGRPKEHLIMFKNLKYAHAQLADMTVKERMQSFGLREDRADVIVPASEIFLFVMKKIEADHVVAPKIGVADGLIYEMYQQRISKNENNNNR